MTGRSRRTALRLAAFVLVGSAACSEPARDETADAARGAAQELERASEELTTELRSTLDELSAEVDGLEARYQGAGETAAEEWRRVRGEIDEARRDAEQTLARLRDASGDEAAEARAEAAEALEALTRRVERARLEAAASSEAFSVEARARLAEIEGELRTLDAEASEVAADAGPRVRDAVETLRAEAEALDERASALAGATRDEIDDERERITEALAELAVAVRRQWLELRADLTGGR